MKPLSPSVPRVMFVVGIPGAGKTYFAEQFAETFGAPFIEYAAIRSQLTSQPTYSKTEDAVVAQLAKYQLGELLKTNHPIIFEGGCEARSDRLALARFVREFGYQPMLIWVQTEPTTAMRRAVMGTRERRRPVISEERFNHLVQRFTPPNTSERPVVLSGKHTYTSQSRTILKHLAQLSKRSAEIAGAASVAQAAQNNTHLGFDDPGLVPPRPALAPRQRNIGGSSLSIQ